MSKPKQNHNDGQGTARSTSRRCAAVLVMVALLTGCAGYRLGPTNTMVTGEKSIRVMPFSNATIQPRVSDEVTQQMRKAVQREATFRLSSRDDADVIVTGEVINYQRYEMSFAPDDVLTVRDFRVTLTAHVTARNRVTGETILDKDIRGNTLVRVGYDLTSAERQALPLLAADLARNAIDAIADGEW